MKKLLLISLIFLLAIFNVNAAGIVDLTGMVPNPLTADPSSSYGATLTIDNTGDAAIDVITITSTDLILGANKINAPTISNIANLLVSTPQTKDFTIQISGVPAGTYSGTITATDASNSANKDTIAYSVIVNPKAVLTLNGLTNDKLIMISQADSLKSKKFTVKNDGSLNLNPTATISGNFTDNDDDQITLTLSSISSILPGASNEVTITADIPDDVDLGIYSGTVTVTDSANGVTDTFNLEVQVDPEICKDGRVSNNNPVDNSDEGNIRLDIKDPDDGDNFGPGENINIDVNVENHKDEDLDIIVEAKLYNIDQDNELVSIESDSIEVEKNNDDDFDLTLKVPVSDSDLDEGDNFKLFIKAYEDGNEDENCNYESIDLDFERNTHDVSINKVLINPSVVSCSETVNIGVEVQNIGKKEEDNVQLILRETTLGLDLSSEVFNLKKFDKAGDTALKTFTFEIPKNAAEGDYFIETKAFFTNKVVSTLNKLTVDNCQSIVSQPVLTLPQTSFTVVQGKVFTIPLTLQNPGTQTATYSVSAQAENWADVSAEQRISVAPGQQTTLYVYITPKPSLSAGSYTGTITVKQDGNIIKTSSITATVSGSQGLTGGTVYQPSLTLDSIWRNLAGSTAFWIAGIVIVFALIVFILTALLRPR